MCICFQPLVAQNLRSIYTWPLKKGVCKVSVVLDRHLAENNYKICLNFRNSCVKRSQSRQDSQDFRGLNSRGRGLGCPRAGQTSTGGKRAHSVRGSPSWSEPEGSGKRCWAARPAAEDAWQEPAGGGCLGPGRGARRRPRCRPLSKRITEHVRPVRRGADQPGLSF